MEQGQTSNKKSYNPPTQSTLPELQNVENSAAYLLPVLQSMRESNPHLRLLDMGACSGSLSVSFAKLIPDGHVTGVDLDANTLSRARAVAKKAGVKNIDFQEANAYKLPFADDTFDITFGHQVLIHQASPWDVLSEMLRVTKPGGVVAAREPDYDTEAIWPDLPPLHKFHTLGAGLLSAAGGTPTAGRQLASWALKAGVDRSQITLSFSTSSAHTKKEKNNCAQEVCGELRGKSLREQAINLNLSTEKECEEMAKAWEEWAARADASLAILQGEIIIRK